MMRVPWWSDEDDESAPEPKSVLQELDDLLDELQRYEHRLNKAVDEYPAPRDRAWRRGGLTGE